MIFFDTPLRTASMRKVRIGHQKLFRARISIITIPNSINEEWTGKNIVAIAVRKPQRNKRVNLIKNTLRRKFHCPLNLSRLRLRNDVKMIARSLSEFFVICRYRRSTPSIKKGCLSLSLNFLYTINLTTKNEVLVNEWRDESGTRYFFMKQFW